MGQDLPDAGAYWRASGAPAERFVHADAAAGGGLPFTDGAFEVVLRLGVIEHVGTVAGPCSLRPDYQQVRARFAAELLRVLAPGGRLLLSCPNKLFPVDVQHGPRDPSTPARWRWPLFARTGLNVHKTWGRYRLLSAAELHALFVTGGGSRSSRSLPPGGFLGLSGLSTRPWPRVGVHTYLDALPAWARPTPLNPYTLVEME